MDRLFSKGFIGSMELKNRIVMPPMGTCFANTDGTICQRLLNYYERRAIGGVGLIIVEASAVATEKGHSFPAEIGIYHDKFIPGLSELAGAVKKHGVRAAIQLHHAGSQATSRVTGKQPVAPSAIPYRPGAEIPTELSLGEVEELIESFVSGAERAEKAGFNAVEVHGGHGYLINQFLSRRTNKRADKYGGSTENRARFALEIVKGIKSRLGENFPVLFRISADEYVPGGMDLDGTKKIVPLLEEAGIDALHVSAGTYQSVQWIIQPGKMEYKCLAHLSEGIKKIARIPVIAVGRINSPQLAEQVLRDNQADLVSMGRALIADPDLPAKAEAKNFEMIRPCIGCNSCIDRLFKSLPLQCAVNPEAGIERHEETAASEKRSIVIVGAGPAGMHAAACLSEHGHRVRLYEKSRDLGGSLVLASLFPWKKDVAGLIGYYRNRLKASGAELVFSKEVTAEVASQLKQEGFQVFILSTGGKPIIPEIERVNTKLVLDLTDVLNGNVKVGHKVVVIGGGSTGCEVALYLAEAGHKVTIVEKMDKWGQGVGSTWKWSVFGPGFERLGVELFTGSICKKVGDCFVELESYKGLLRIPMDNVIIATGVLPLVSSNANLCGSFAGEHHQIGDCVQPGSIRDAIIGAENIIKKLN